MVRIFFLDCEDRGLEFWGLVGNGTSAESVSKKTKQPSSKTKVESADEKRKNWSEFFFSPDCEDRGLEFWGLIGNSTSAESVSKKPKQKNKK